MNSRKVDTYDNVVIFAKHAKAGKSSYSIALAFKAIESLSGRLHRLYERQCNGDEVETLVERLQRRVELEAEDMGYSVDHQTDPRGCSVTLLSKGKEVVWL